MGHTQIQQISAVRGWKQILLVAVSLWLAGLGVGMWQLWDYSFQPGDDVGVQSWPDDTKLVLAEDRPTLVMFVHPLCPCTSATLGELENLLVRLDADYANATLPKLLLVYTAPPSADAKWKTADNVAQGTTLFGTPEVTWDEGGEEAARFGAHTSGVTYLFGADGKLWYFGGLNPSRGHVGESFGKQYVRELLAEYQLSKDQLVVAQTKTCPAFGCSLLLAEEVD